MADLWEERAEVSPFSADPCTGAEAAPPDPPEEFALLVFALATLTVFQSCFSKFKPVRCESPHLSPGSQFCLGTSICIKQLSRQFSQGGHADDLPDQRRILGPSVVPTSGWTASVNPKNLTFCKMYSAHFSVFEGGRLGSCFHKSCSGRGRDSHWILSGISTCSAPSLFSAAQRSSPSGGGGSSFFPSFFPTACTCVQQASCEVPRHSTCLTWSESSAHARGPSFHSQC